jgi:putative ABC transport system permease protein
MFSRWFDVGRLRVRSLLRRAQVERELERELHAHLEQQVEENISLGMSAVEARRAALRSFGGVEQMREQARDARGLAVFENVVRDLRYTLRALLREPMLLVAAGVSIALGAGANLVVFSLAREFIFAPPDVRHPGELVQMQVSHGSHASYPRWRDLATSGALAEVAGYSLEKQMNWLDGDAAVSIVPLLVTANFFEVSGVPLAFGRGFTAAEANAERDPHVIVVSHGFWQRELAGDSAVIGRALVLNGESYTILGVLEPHVRSVVGFGITPGVYVPLSRKLVPELSSPTAAVVQLLGRLQPGQSLEEGRAAVDAVDRRLAHLQGDSIYGGVNVFAPVGSLGSARFVRVIGPFFALLGLVSLLVLLIACANVAGLLIARGTRRRQEIAIRLAIGGTRWRLLQQLLIEGFWLALIGTVGGLAFSFWFLQLLDRISLPVPVPIELHFAPDGPALVCALGLVILSMVCGSLLPAISSTKSTLIPALKREEPFQATRRLSARGVLLVGQVTLSTLLLVTAFLFLRNLGRTQVINPGFEVDQALVTQIGFVQGREESKRTGYLQTAVERLESLPGVEQAAYASGVPLTVHGGSTSGRSARIGNRAATEHVEFARLLVGPGYFSTLRIRLLRGREFRASDVPGAPAVAIVNEEFARRYLRAEGSLGTRLRFEDEGLDFEIVGIVANGKHRTLGEDQRAAFYLPVLQHPEQLNVAFVLARTSGDPGLLITPVRQSLGALDRSVSVEAQPMQAALKFALLPSQIGAAILGSLGLLALVLAAFGLYAIVSYNASRRIGEIAIRTALGATRAGIFRLVIADASLLVGAGLLSGLGIAALVTAPLGAFLVVGLSVTDPLSFAGTAIIFLLVSVLASWLPARSATRISPALAMRLE